MCHWSEFVIIQNTCGVTHLVCNRCCRTAEGLTNVWRLAKRSHFWHQCFRYCFVLVIFYGSDGCHVSHVQRPSTSACLCAASPHDFHPNKTWCFPPFAATSLLIFRSVSSHRWPTHHYTRQSFRVAMDFHRLALMMSYAGVLPLYTAFNLNLFLARLFGANIWCGT